MNLEECKIKDFDDIFYATRDSQGYENAVDAIKYVLFDIKDVLEDSVPDNKYLYISSNNDARKKAMLLQQDDLAQILIKYCMASFGLRGVDFSIKDDDFTLDRKRIDRLDISAYEMIEKVAYAAMGDIYTAYVFLFANKKLLSFVIDYMIEERYVSLLKDALDSFEGIIDNNDIESERRFSFYDAYTNLDKNFAELKRNNKDYIK